MKTIYLVAFFISYLISASAQQLEPPVMRCIDVLNAGRMSFSWTPPSDPTNVFSSYEIFGSNTANGTYTLLNSINTITTSSYLDITADGDQQTRYYYIRTKSSAGTQTSTPSDTINSVFLNVNYNPQGINSINWSLMYKLPQGSALTYTLDRLYSPSAWTELAKGLTTNYIDSITRCFVSYIYRVRLKNTIDGCFSTSNTRGGSFTDKISPKTPSFNSISINSIGQAVLGWKPDFKSGAARWIIYKKNNNANMVIVDTTQLNPNSNTYTYTLAVTGPETFAIAALDSCNNTSTPTNPQTSMYLAPIVYHDCSRSIRCLWTPYQNIPNGLLKYTIMASINGGPYTALGTTTLNTYTITGLVPTANYCILIEASNATSKIFANSNTQCVNTNTMGGPNYLYIKSVSVLNNFKSIITYTLDNTQPYSGVELYRSLDQANYVKVDYKPFSTTSDYTFYDTKVINDRSNYYYKIKVSDNCGVDGYFSNIAGNILITQNNSASKPLENIIQWQDYNKWLGNVLGYNIFRSKGYPLNFLNIGYVSLGTTTFSDNIENEPLTDSGEYIYKIQAMEGLGNPLGYKDSSMSNIITVFIESNYFIPTAFTPEGLNPIWKPYMSFLVPSTYKLSIFNRWGGVQFETTDFTKGWDGSGAPIGLYNFVLIFSNSRGEYITKFGHFNLIK